MERPTCLLSFDTKLKIICLRMTGLGQLVLLHVRNDLRRIIVFVAMTVISEWAILNGINSVRPF